MKYSAAELSNSTWEPRGPRHGLYYYKARFYNPKLGRFMQSDPISYGDSLNMYAYAGGDPVNSVIR